MFRKNECWIRLISIFICGTKKNVSNKNKIWNSFALDFFVFLLLLLLFCRIVSCWLLFLSTNGNKRKKNIFVTNKKESKSERIWNYSSAFFNVFVVSCLFIYLFFSLSAVAVFVGWLRREWVWWEKECFCCCWWVSVYFRWIRYNNLQKTEIVESINAGFILMAPTTQPHFHLFFNALSLFCACFHLRPCMCWTEYERTHRERAHDTGIV